MYNTKLEACREWVSQFNAIPESIICKLHLIDENDLFEITPVTIGNTVYSFEHNQEAQVLDKTNNILKIKLDDGDIVEIEESESEPVNYGYFPMWSTLWAFDDWSDREWLKDHLQEMADCGFRIYESEDYDYVFGIDGAGYDFYEAHWLPLYEKRGLHWHKEV